MYSDVDKSTYYQGDIIKDFPFTTIPLGEPKALRFDRQRDTYKLVPLSEFLKDGVPEKIILATNSFISDAIIVSQSCDIQHRDHVHVCPVFKLEGLEGKLLKKGFQKSKVKSQILLLKKDKINYYLYLPRYSTEDVDLAESYVDLQYFGILPRENLGDYKREVSLSDLGRHRLAFKLLNLYARPI